MPSPPATGFVQVPGLDETIQDIYTWLNHMGVGGGGAIQSERLASGLAVGPESPVILMRAYQYNSGGEERGAVVIWITNNADRVSLVQSRGSSNGPIPAGSSFSTLTIQSGPPPAPVDDDWSDDYYLDYIALGVKAQSYIQVQVKDVDGLVIEDRLFEFDFNRLPDFREFTYWWGAYDPVNDGYPLSIAFNGDEDTVSVEWAVRSTTPTVPPTDAEYNTGNIADGIVEANFSSATVVLTGADAVAPEGTVHVFARARGGAGATGDKGLMPRGVKLIQAQAPSLGKDSLLQVNWLVKSMQQARFTGTFSHSSTAPWKRIEWGAGQIEWAGSATPSATIAAGYIDLVTGQEYSAAHAPGTDHWSPDLTRPYGMVYCYFDADVDANSFQFSTDFDDVLPDDTQPNRTFIGMMRAASTTGEDLTSSYAFLLGSGTSEIFITAAVAKFGNLEALFATLDDLVINKSLTIDTGGEFVWDTNNIIDNIGITLSAEGGPFAETDANVFRSVEPGSGDIEFALQTIGVPAGSFGNPFTAASTLTQTFIRTPAPGAGVIDQSLTYFSNGLTAKYLRTDNTLMFIDVAAPGAGPVAGTGYAYKLTSDPGLWWHANGVASPIDLTGGGTGIAIPDGEIAVGTGVGIEGSAHLFENVTGVSVGPIAPKAKLHVYKGASGIVTLNTSADDLYVEHSTHGGMTIGTPSASIGRLMFGSELDARGAELSWQHSTGELKLTTAFGSSVLILGAGNLTDKVWVSTTGVGIGGAATAALDVTGDALASGDVGVGTLSPGAVLPTTFVAGRVLEIKSDLGSTDAGLLLTRSDGVTASHVWHDGNTWSLRIDNAYDHANADIRFRVRTFGTPVEILTLAGTSGVGIMNTAPTEALDVTGNVLASGHGIFGGGATVTSAVLTLNGTTGALVVPRLSAVQITALTPSAGMIVHDTGAPGFKGYSDSSWQYFAFVGDPLDTVLTQNGAFVDNRMLRAHNTDQVQNTGITIDDSDNLTDIAGLSMTGTLAVNAATPLAKVHISQGASGIVALNSAADDLFVEDNSHAGITIGTPDASISRLMFANASDSRAAEVSWDYTNQELRLATNSTSAAAVILGVSNAVDKVWVNTTGLGVGGAPTELLHLQGATPRLFVDSSDNGATALSQALAGLVLTAVGMNTTAKYTGAVLFASTDSAFVTEPTKTISGVIGRATEGYSLDTHSGGAVDIFTVPNSAGTSPTPLVRFTVDQTGYVGIGITAPTEALDVVGNITATGELRGTVFESVVDGTDKIRFPATGQVAMRAGGSDIVVAHSTGAVNITGQIVLEGDWTNVDLLSVSVTETQNTSTAGPHHGVWLNHTVKPSVSMTSGYYGYRADFILDDAASTDVAFVRCFGGGPATAVTYGGNITNFSVFQAQSGSTTILGSGTITNLTGFSAGDFEDGTNNYGFKSSVTSGSGKWGFYAEGDAANYFDGVTTFNGQVTIDASVNYFEKASHASNPSAGYLKVYGLNDNRLYFRDSGGTAHQIRTDQDSGGNADTLDSLDSTQFLRSDVADVKTSGDLTLNDNIALNLGTSTSQSALYSSGTNTLLDMASGVFQVRDSGNNVIFEASQSAAGLYSNGTERVVANTNGIEIGGIATFGDDITNQDFITISSSRTQNTSTAGPYHGIWLNHTVQPSASMTSGYYGFRADFELDDAASTDVAFVRCFGGGPATAATYGGNITNFSVFQAQSGATTILGSGTITNLTGFSAGDFEDGTNNYGFKSSVTVGSGKWGFYSEGNAANYFAGDVQIDGDVGFYATSPVAQQTGVAVTAAAIHAALVNLGLITA